MAQLTNEEFQEAVAALAEHLGVPRLRDRLASMNAFTSRRGLNSVEALAARLLQLTGGLRRQVPATYAFSSLWTEMVGARVGEDQETSLEALADKVNACLGDDDTIVAGRERELDDALGGYREALEAAAGPAVARLDMLFKAVPAVAERLRQHLTSTATTAAPADD